MSNRPTNTKKKHSSKDRHFKKAIAKRLSKMNGNRSQTIDFTTRVLDKTLLVNAGNATMKIGNGTQMMKDIPNSFVIKPGIVGGIEAVIWVGALKEEDIDKVIIYGIGPNSGFVHKTLTQFYIDLFNGVERAKKNENFVSSDALTVYTNVPTSKTALFVNDVIYVN